MYCTHFFSCYEETVEIIQSSVHSFHVFEIDYIGARYRILDVVENFHIINLYFYMYTVYKSLFI